jgi:molecular chaperone DnaK
MNALNAAWQAASAEMYQASGGGPSAGAGAGPNPGAGAGAGADQNGNNVSDVEYEEVNDGKK